MGILILLFIYDFLPKVLYICTIITLFTSKLGLWLADIRILFLNILFPLFVGF